MKAILSSIVVVGALVCGAARAQNTSATTPPPADLAEMKAAIEKSRAKGELTPGEAAEMSKIVDVLRAERQRAEIENQLRANEDKTTAQQY